MSFDLDYSLFSILRPSITLSTFTRNYSSLSRKRGAETSEQEVAFSFPHWKDLPQGTRKIHIKLNTRYSSPPPGRVRGWRRLTLSIRNLIFGCWGCPRHHVRLSIRLAPAERAQQIEAGSQEASRCIVRAKCRGGNDPGARFQSERGGILK